MNDQKKILALLNARDQQAIPELGRAFGGLCRSIAGHALKNTQDIEEVVSDAYLAVWNSIPPEQPLSLKAYISRITRNLSLTRYRNNTAECRDERLQVSLEELELCLPDNRDPEQVLDSARITQAINAFLATQSKINRYIFIHRYYCMDATRDIAKQVGMTDQSVRSRLMRMRAQLREVLEKEEIPI